MIGFRVDANSEIGTGHLMRCLAIAEKIKAQGYEVHFFTVDAINTKLIEEKGFRCHVLKGVYTEIEKDYSQLSVLISGLGVKVLLVDSYFVSQSYLKKLCDLVKVIYIDDLHEMVYPCDLLINYTIFADKIDYSQMYKGTNTKLLLGCNYVPLREEFETVRPKKHKDKPEKVLVLSGGTDQYHFLLHFVEQVVCNDAYCNVIFQVVCGKYNTDKEKLKALQVGYKNLEVYENLSELKDYMVNADVAISAAGTTLYELTACGTATIGYALADNQLENLQVFSEKGYVISLGDIRKSFPEEELIRALQKASELAYRKEVEKKMRTLVDGYGTSYLADEIINLSLMEKEVKDE